MSRDIEVNLKHERSKLFCFVTMIKPFTHFVRDLLHKSDVSQKLSAASLREE
jgi:hypothetical protein